jgi:hypothetical protein
VAGSSDGRRYALDLMNATICFKIHLLRDVLAASMKFLRQIEKRGSCLDQFALNVAAAQETIKNALDNFDFNTFQDTLNEIEKYAPQVQPTSRSTRFQQQHRSNSYFDLDELKEIGGEFIQFFLKSLNHRFDNDAKEIIHNLCLLSSPSKMSPQEVMNNPLITQYTSTISFRHKGVDNNYYERTDKPLLNYQDLKCEIHAFLTLVGNITTIPLIISQLAKHGSEQCPEWYRLYQILGTFAIGSNEAERTFSALRRIKSWLRNRLSDVSLEILVKVASLGIELEEDSVDFIVHDFIRNPGRAKSRNITLFYENEEEPEEIF